MNFATTTNYWSTWSSFRDLEGTIGKMIDIHQRHRVAVSMFGLWGFNYLDPDPARRAEARANLDKGIGYAQRLGASCICLGTGSIPGESLGFQIRRFLEYFPAVADRLHQAGIVPVFYAGHGATILNDLAAFEAVWEHLPDLKIKFDPANWRHMGQDYLEVCRRYARKIGHVHIKENTWHQGKLIGEPPAGMGDIEFPKVLAFLYEADYQGWLSLEPHGPLWSKPPLREKMLLLSKRSLDPMLL